MHIPLRQYARLLMGYLRPQWPRVLLLAVLLFTGIGLQLANPQIIRRFIDTAQAGGSLRTLWLTAALFVAVALLQQIVSMAATYVGENVGWTATNALRADLAAHCLKLDMSFHKARTPGELIERIDGDVNALSSFFSKFVIDMLSNLVLMIGVLVLLFFEDWRVGAGMSVFALLALVILIRLRSIAVPYWTAVREARAHFYGFLGERLAGTEDIRSSAATGYVMRQFYALLRGWLPLERRAGIAGYSMWMTTLLLFAGGNALAFVLGAYLYRVGTITIGTVYIIFYYTELLRQPIEQIRTQLQELQKADASIKRVEELFHTRSRLNDGIGTPIPSGALAVAFDYVSFEYNDEGRTTEDESPNTSSGDPAFALRPSSSVLNDVTFTLAPGRVLGLLGRTGSGKTTLARLLLRLYDPTAGTICLGGVPAFEARLGELRRRVGMVTQDVQLFQSSVRDNLTFFNREISDARIMDALDDLGLHDWLSKLPAGLDSELGAGAGLSAGEAQLLAFARLFLADPGLVILDEASSRLDPATEQLVERAVSKLLRPDDGQRTGIIIAHRLATVQRADDILILEGGRILEYGPREQLARNPDSHFAHLLRTGMEEVLA
ncbi:MAG: ABC transporter ATP-binding protein [Roseiflexaceae bacterium]